MIRMAKMFQLSPTLCFASSFQGASLDPHDFWSGGDGGGVPRVPIPNTTVKTSSADGTWTAGSWESRTLPGRMHARAVDEVDDQG